MSSFSFGRPIPSSSSARRLLRPSANLAPGLAKWRMFTAQSGRLSFGSQLTSQQRQSAMRHCLAWLSVLRRPASAFAPWQATAQASRSHGLRRRCLAPLPTPVKVAALLLASQQTFRLAHAFEHPVQARWSVPQHSGASNTASA